MSDLGYDEVEYDGGEFGDAVYGGVLPMPDVAAIRSHLDGAGVTTSWSDEVIAQTILTERAAQARICRVPFDDGPWPADLADALRRRIARNLCSRTLPLGFQATPTDGGVTALRLGWDIEIKRLESPFRRMVMG